MNNTTFDRIITVFLVLVCIVLAVATFVRNGKSNNIQPREAVSATSKSVNVNVIQASHESFVRNSKVMGEITTDNNDTNVYPAIGGLVSSVAVKRGDYVEKGDLLFTVDPSKPGMKYKESEVYAPISGTVAEVNTKIGDNVSTQSLIVIRGEGELKVSTAISEKNIGTLTLGAKAIVKSDSYEGRTWDAYVSYISSELDSASRSLPIELSFTNGSEGLLDGMYVTSYVEVETIEDVITVPSTAIGTFAGDTVVYVADTGVAKRCKVTVGKSDGTVTVIQEGLNEGDLIIVAGTVSDQTPISIVEEK